MEENLWNIFLPIFENFESLERLKSERPLLAHYTSMEVLEKIISSEELWFSNPMFMNDLDEMRFGLNGGSAAFLNSKRVEDAAGTPTRAKLIKEAFEHYFTTYENESAFDTYVFCLSEHLPENDDGLLSMWRGYGGYGKGAALVFDTGKLTLQDESPVNIAAVKYASTEDRLKTINKIIEDWAKIVATTEIPDENLHYTAYYALEAFKIFALVTKHDGFREEQEWRVIYTSERDPDQLLNDRFGHVIGPNGVEPKFRFKLEPIPGVSAPNLSLSQILDKIILGPSISSPLAKRAVERMLENMGRHDLIPKLHSSTIPLRST